MINKTKKLKGFTLVELLVVLAIIGLLAAIGIPAILAAQRSSRNTTRLKQLEAIRNSMADYFTKYNEEPIVYANIACTQTPNKSTSIYIAGASSCQKRIEVVLTDGYTVTSTGAECSTQSTAKDIYYAISTTSGTISLCKEGSGEEPLNYKQTNQL